MKHFLKGDLVGLPYHKIFSLGVVLENQKHYSEIVQVYWLANGEKYTQYSNFLVLLSRKPLDNQSKSR